MFAVAAYFKDSRVDLLGFAWTTEQVSEMIEEYISRYGADFLGSNGCQFNVELAA